MGYRVMWATWGNRVQGVSGTGHMGNGYRGCGPHEAIGYRGMGSYGQWGTGGMGYIGNGSHGQWGTGVWGIWAMRPTGDIGYKGYEAHVGNRGTWGNGVQGVWATWAMGYMGNGVPGERGPMGDLLPKYQKDVKLSKRCQMSKNETPRLWRRFTKKLN